MHNQSHFSGHEIPPHIHNYLPREVTYTQEVLFIKYGKVRVEFYTQEKKYFKSLLLYKGDIILLANAGHGFYIEEDAAMIEIKQGPYEPLADKDFLAAFPLEGTAEAMEQERLWRGLFNGEHGDETGPTPGQSKSPHTSGPSA